MNSICLPVRMPCSSKPSATRSIAPQPPATIFRALPAAQWRRRSPLRLRRYAFEPRGDLFFVFAERVLPDRLGVMSPLCLSTCNSDNEVVSNRLNIFGRISNKFGRNSLPREPEAELIRRRVTRILAGDVLSNLSDRARVYSDPSVHPEPRNGVPSTACASQGTPSAPDAMTGP